MADPVRERIRQAKLFLRDRGTIYREVFAHPRAHYVLKDLSRFCRAHDAPVAHNQRTGEIDERATLILIGRQEVWRRIQQHLNLDEEELWAIFGEKALEDVAGE